MIIKGISDLFKKPKHKIIYLYKIQNFRYSIKYINNILFLSLFLISSIVIASISSYYNNLLRTQLYNNTMNSLALYNKNLSTDLSALETYLFQLSTYNTDMSLLNTTNDQLKVYIAKARILKLLTESRPAFSEINGLFFYNSLSDDFIYSGDSNVCSTYIRDLLRKNRNNLNRGPINYTKWGLYQSTNSAYFIKYLYNGNTIMGAWTDIKTLSNIFNGVFYPDSFIFFTDTQGKIVGNQEFSDFSIQPEKSLSSYIIYKNKSTKKEYLVTVNRPDYCDNYMLAFIPLSNITNYLTPVYQKLTIIIVFIALMITFLTIMYKKILDIPLLSLTKVLKSMQKGEYDSQIPDNVSNCKEIIEINRSFNQMIMQIQGLKINIYEEQITKSKIELQYIRSQISPHFLINCLASLSSLATANNRYDNQELIRKMFQTLSDHLRYTLSTRPTVPLREEAAYTENYLELISMRYPNCLTYSISIAKEIQDATAFPMIILMLTENTIKHNMIMGEKLSIKITAFFDETPDTSMIHLIHIDSGSGFDKNTLEILNHILDYPERCKDGHNIGIYNIVKTLQIIYKNEASIEFSNEPDWGARIDIFIPFHKYLEDEVV